MRCLVGIAQVVLVVLPLLAAPVAGAQQPGACCVITAINAAAGTVTARETATGRVFEFRPRLAAVLGALRVGQTVQANFARNQVSLDGRSVCCTITRAPAAEAPAAPAPTARTAPTTPTNPTAPTTPAPSAAPARQNPAGAAAPAGRGAPSAGARISTSFDLPRVTFGEPMPRPMRRAGNSALQGAMTETIVASVGGRETSADMLHLNGREAIRAANLPDGAKRLLEMHHRKLRLRESQYYLVNPKLAAEWAATHPVPADVKPKDSDDKSECGKVSINGLKDCGSDAVESVEAEFERARTRAQDWWDESTDKLEKEWNAAQGCFSDHTLPGGAVPVRFSIAPAISVKAEQEGSRGSAEGSVSGTVTLGIPMESDFQADIDFLYVPCLPFVFRPKSIGADGSLTVGQQLALDLLASGRFNKAYTIPPTGGPQIPIQVLPIIIGGVPVAVLDISAYIEGEMRVKAEGKASGRFTVATSNRSTFEFTCDGSGCDGKSKSAPAPVTTSQSAQIEGQVSAEPGLYVALQLSLNYNLLQARAGPQPFLLGVANGCGAVAATQQSGGASSVATNYALTADLDWGTRIRAEALAGGQVLGKRWEEKVMDNRHIWFGDLAPGGSTALVPEVGVPAQAMASQPAAVVVKMPSCYPYDGRVFYQIAWTGGGTPAPTPACQWQAASGVCAADPARELALTFVWPTAGTHMVSAQLVRDRHGEQLRTFTPAPPPRQVSITVAPR